jgi:hypothetical protein
MNSLVIIIPMAGNSSRFKNAGYLEPKFKLIAHDKSLFEYSVESFKRYFDTATFLFICRKEHDAFAFVNEKTKKIGIRNFKIKELESETQGQAETVLLGLNSFDIPNDSSIIIFNIDTFRVNFKLPNQIEIFDGYLEVFKGIGDHWSFVDPMIGTNKVLKTTEKERISNLCSDGLYYFKSAEIFRKSFETLSKSGYSGKKEFYIAPMYNDLIKKGFDIRFDLIDENDITFCGIPEEYEAFLNQKP